MLILIIVTCGVFYGGMKYGESKAAQGFGQQKGFPSTGDTSPTGPMNGNLGNMARVGFTTGEVISKDEESITIKLQDGGSKIIFFSDSTEISKTAEGSINDIEVGKQITVTGEQNSDGSYTAKTIQLSPRLPIPRNSEQ